MIFKLLHNSLLDKKLQILTISEMVFHNLSCISDQYSIQHSCKHYNCHVQYMQANGDQCCDRSPILHPFPCYPNLEPMDHCQLVHWKLPENIKDIKTWNDCATDRGEWSITITEMQHFLKFYSYLVPCQRLFFSH